MYRHSLAVEVFYCTGFSTMIAFDKEASCLVKWYIDEITEAATVRESNNYIYESMDPYYHILH